jgi:NAD-reducing hydrogenase large subunit
VHNVVIDPVSRIEGHAKITLRLDDDGRVDDARFHVTEFRGFEEFCRGRTLWEMPGLTARTCGICPMSHLIASAKAADAILAVQIPPAAELLRRLGNLGQIVQSHALSYFHLSAPDLLLGMESDPALRNLFGLIQAEPEIARRGIGLRRFGQEIVAAISGKRIHGPWIVPGGVAQPLTVGVRDALAAQVEPARQAALDTIDGFVALVDRFVREISVFGAFDSLFLGHCGPDGRWETYGDRLRVTAADGSIVADRLDPADYRVFLGEAGGGDSYLKSPYWRATVDGNDLGPGMYRVGPLARLNVATHFGTEAADAALAGYRERTGAVATSSFHYHYARLLEVLAAVELIEQLLADPVLLDTNVRAQAGVNRHRGVGSSEAPRGTLFHDYTVSDDGLVESVNMLIATGQNNLAMNRTVLQVAREYITGPKIPEGTLNRIEAGIRAFDPCLSCSTHALGQMPMLVQLVDAGGEIVCEVRRD